VGVSRDCPIFSGTPYYLRNGKSYRFQIWPVHSEDASEQKPIKNFREKGAWAYPGTVQMFWVPHYLRNGKSYGFQIWPVHSEGPSEQKPIKNFKEREVWAYPGTAQFFQVPLLSQEREKVLISNLASTFRRSMIHGCGNLRNIYIYGTKYFFGQWTLIRNSIYSE